MSARTTTAPGPRPPEDELGQSPRHMTPNQPSQKTSRRVVTATLPPPMTRTYSKVAPTEGARRQAPIDANMPGARREVLLGDGQRDARLVNLSLVAVIIHPRRRIRTVAPGRFARK